MEPTRRKIIPVVPEASRPRPKAPTSCDELWQAVDPYRKALLEHDVYSMLVTKRSVQTFLDLNCYAIMDFMCLHKSLQQRLTVVSMH